MFDRHGLLGFIITFGVLWTSIGVYAEQKTDTNTSPNPKLIKLPFSFPTGMENTPVVFNGRPLLVDNHRPGGFEAKGEDAYLFIIDLITGQEVACLGKGHTFVSGFVDGDELNVFGTEFVSYGNKIEMGGIRRFSTTDLKTWKQETVISPNEGEQIYNSSVCRDDQGYLMAYDSCADTTWAFRFARSKDLSHWQKIPELHFFDAKERTVCGNPTIRYFAPYYYVIYGVHRFRGGPAARYEYQMDSTAYITFIARSKDLEIWELSPTKYPMLDPVPGEGINNTDADLFECEGNTYIYYATGDQATWGTIRVAMYSGPMKELLESYFPENVPMIQFDTIQKKYIYP